MTDGWMVSVSGEQSSVGCAVEDWLLGTQAAPAWEAGASTPVG